MLHFGLSTFHLYTGAVTLFLICAFPSGSQEPEYLFRVKVIIEFDGKEAKALESFVRRELRKLHDVEIDNDHPQWTIRATADKLRLKDGFHSGYIVYYVIVSNLDLSMYLRDDAPPYAKTLASDINKLTNWGVFVKDSEFKKIYEALATLVLDFDANHLEPLRQLRNR